MARKRAEPGTGGKVTPETGETARDEAIGAIPETPPEFAAAPAPAVDPDPASGVPPESPPDSPTDRLSGFPPQSQSGSQSGAQSGAPLDPATDLPEGPERPLSDPPGAPADPEASPDPMDAPFGAPAASAPGPDPWGAGEISPARIEGNGAAPDSAPTDPLTGEPPLAEPLTGEQPHVEPLTGEQSHAEPFAAERVDPPAAYADPLGPDPLHGEATRDPLDAEPEDPLGPAPTETVEPADPWVRAEDPAEIPPAAIPPVAPPPVEAAVEEEAVEEDHGWSFAAKALAALVLLTLGAAAGIWAAPRIAPHLPAGMAPVAAWLTPGASEAEARLAALDAQVQSEVAALRAQIAGLPDAEALRGQTETLVGQARDGLSGDISALRDQLTQVGDPAQRFGQIESTLSGVGAELTALKGQIEGGAQSLGAAGAASVDTYRAELDGLRAEVGRLSGEVGALNGRLDQAETAASERASAAEAAAATAEAEASASVDVAAARADIAQIRAALVNGAPFQAELDRFATDAGAAIPAGLSAAAATGVATEAELEAGFSEAAHAAIRSSIVASAGDGFWNRTRAFVEAQVASRALSPQEGSDPDAVLSRVEAALKQNDLATAVREAQALPTEAQAAMGDWIAQARLRADAEAGLAELSAAPNMN